MDSKRVPGSIAIGESQGYLPLHVKRRPYVSDDLAVMNVFILTTRWTFSDEDRARIAAGGDLFIEIYATSHPPIHVTTVNPEN